MATPILSEAENDCAAAEPSDDLKLICYGNALPIERMHSPPRAGEWLVSLITRGPRMVTLGAIGRRFKTRREAVEWRHRNLSGLSDYMVALKYIPSAADHVRLERAPARLDVPFMFVRIQRPILDDGAQGEPTHEMWASCEEAQLRVTALKEQHRSAEVTERWVREFSRTFEDLAEREEFLKQVNGDKSSIADGSVWETNEAKQDSDARCGGGWSKGHLPGRYSLTIYTSAVVRPIENVVHSKQGVFGKSAIVGEFETREEAERAGFDVLAKRDDVFAFVSWPLEIPDAAPRYCFVARCDRKSSKVVSGSRISDFFEGADRYKDASRARDLLSGRWPDATVFYASKRSHAVRRMAEIDVSADLAQGAHA